MKLIINADDLGRSIEVNNTIFHLIENNKVTSATIIANSLAVDDAINRVNLYPSISFGVHLTLAGFKPLTCNSAFEKLLDKNGNFNKKIRQIQLTPKLKQAIFDEWCFQIGKILSYGVKISHIDSHYHVHTLPQLFIVL